MVDDSVEILTLLVERVKDDDGNVTNMEENNDDNDEDLGEVLNTLRGLVYENLKKRLKNGMKVFFKKTLGSGFAEASSKILPEHGYS